MLPRSRPGGMIARWRASRKRYPFRAPSELAGGRGHYPVVIAGAGPVGLAAARDLGLRGIRTVVLDEDDKVSVGSRAICWAKRTLEIFDRLGCAAPMMQKGVTWNTGKVFYGDDREPVFSFDLLPDRSQCFPAFINLQQYYVEECLVDLVEATPLAELRWQSRVTSVESRGDHVEIGVSTPQGDYRLTADHLIAADGSRSAIRGNARPRIRGRGVPGPFPDRRHPDEGRAPVGALVLVRSALRPRAVGAAAQAAGRRLAAGLPARLAHRSRRSSSIRTASRERVRRMLGDDAVFELEWCSIYTFQCRMLERFVHDRVIFAGDAAHLVSPFGARGANGGVQDVDNLCWKLALVQQGIAPRSLLESYDAERVHAARENLLHSTRSTDFITPKTAVEPRVPRRGAGARARPSVRARLRQQRSAVAARRAL